MRISPLDVHNHRFSRRMRGVDPGEVQTFLAMVAEDYEGALRENEQLLEQVRRLEGEVGELRTNETLLKETLVTAQSMSEDLRKTASQEAQVVMSEAEVKAEKILDAAHKRAAQLAEDIREMKLLKQRIATAIRHTVETHMAVLDSLSEDGEGDPLVDGKVAYLRRGTAGKTGGPKAESGGGS
ncbi:MAG: DivIVA domain-containing protein [Proteobacteria bacterium]|nr:DivIVA domain-containing protein [Pseudomonadota bacterium]